METDPKPRYSDDPAAYMRWYRRTHKEQQQKVVARYYTSHREEVIKRATEWHKENLPRVLATRKRHYATDPATRTQKKSRDARYYKAKTAQHKQRAKQWRERNGIRRAVYDRMRRKGLTGAIPAWHERDKVQQVYDQCRELNKALNRAGPNAFEVDHIIPLVSKTVCGLHCWANLQILCKSENSAKRNQYQQEW